MLVHDAETYNELKKSENELQEYGGNIPGSVFYDRKLKEVWERAKCSKYYRDISAYSFEAFRNLPITPKSSLKSHPLDFCIINFEDSSKYYATTGTTGEPTPTPRTKKDIIWNAVSVATHWQSVLQPKSKVANLMPSDIVPVGDLISNVCEYLDVAHVRLYPFTTGITDWERVCKIFDTFRPTVLFIAPGVLAQLSRYLKQRGMLDEFARSVQSVMLLGEVNTQPFRERFSRMWRCNVYDASYGSTETGTLAAVMEDKSMRLATSTNYFELLLNNGDVVQPAEGLSGRLVVTPLNLHARPLLRLDTGDNVTITSKFHLGELNSTVRINGRDNESLIVSGANLNIRTVEEVVYSHSDATGYVIEVNETDDTARLILERDVHWDNGQEESLQQKLQHISEQKMSLQWSQVLFVNNLSALNKSGASQKSWKKTNLRFVGEKK